MTTTIQEAYLKALEEFAERENIEARKVWGQQTWDKIEQSKVNGSKGGRPSMPKDDILEGINRGRK